MRLRAICSTCANECGVLTPTGGSKPVLARHDRPEPPWGRTRCPAVGTDAKTGILYWLERERTRAQETLRGAPAREDALREEATRRMCAIRAETAEATATLAAITKAAKKAGAW